MNKARTVAEDHGLEVLAESDLWTVFALPEADRIEVARYKPVMWAGDEDFVDAALEWYDNIKNLDKWLVKDGPPEWQRVMNIDQQLDDPRPYASTGSVMVTTFKDHEVSFTTDAIDVPHLLKVSYFPNWQASGTGEVYRVAPSLMLVVPTQSEVALWFGLTWVEVVGAALLVATVVELLAYGTVYVVRRRRGQCEELPEDIHQL